MKKQWKWGLWVLLLLVVTVYGISTVFKPVKAELIEVQPQTIASTFTEEGVVVPALEREIYSSLTGKVTSVYVQEGQDVKKGDLLIQLDTKEIEYQLAQLRGQLTSVKGQEQQAVRQPYASQVAQQQLAIEQAKLQLEAAQNEFDRINSLYRAGVVSQEVFEEAGRTVRQMENLLSQQEAALQLIQEQHRPSAGIEEQFSGLEASLAAQIALLEYQQAQGRMFAPMNGKIKVMYVKEGQMVTPGAPLVTVFQPGKYQVEVFLLTEDVVDVKPGMKVKVIRDAKKGDVIYNGKVNEIAPAAMEKISALGLVEQRVKVTVQLEGDLSDLRPGYALDVEFTTHREEDKLVVPKTVLFPYEKGDALWVVRNGKAVVQPVETGFETDEDVVIEKGLVAGDLVVRNPQLDGLKEGKKVIAD